MNKLTRNILVIGGVAILSAFTTTKINHLKIDEISNITEDMIEWIYADMENDRVDSEVAEAYILNLEQLLNLHQNNE